MSTLSLLLLKIKRLKREIGQLEYQKSKAIKVEVDALKKIRRASDIIAQNKSVGTVRARQKEIERANTKIQKAKNKQDEYIKKSAIKNLELNKAMSELSKAKKNYIVKLFKE
ncbi:hypothetical protein [Ornithinibacillus sp. JPR2-1]|uniref:hypothetical protein n=1 Tax=Ornithinibacillus sp. JPR2-1 TaxID=2094019 RepID=UPI0031D804D0